MNPIPAQYESLLKDLQNGISAAQAQQTGSLLIGAAALLLFGLLCVPSVRRVIPIWYPPLALPVAALCGRKHLRARGRALRKSRLTEFYARGVRRLTGCWAGAGESGDEFHVGGHLYERDLNILGRGSLFEFLCIARTRAGRAKLADYLLRLPDADESRRRQDAVKELAPNTALREAVHLLGGSGMGRTEWNALQEWMSGAPIRCSGLVRALMAACSVMLGTLILSVFAGAVSPGAAGPALPALIASELLFACVWIRRTRRALEQVREFGLDIGILYEGAELLQSRTFQSPKLAKIAAEARDAVEPLKRLRRMVNAVYECDKEWFYGPSRLLLAPTQIALAMERWKTEHADKVSRWLNAWAEFEALNALGCYAYEHPEDVFPAIVDSGAGILLDCMGHPLIREEDCVRNDVDLGTSRRFYLVSGSNMAGKSTFLRAIGVNAVLAGAGAPIRARGGVLPVFSVCASIATTDSLVDGKSRFLAEVERIQETIRCAAVPKPVLFLFDEIFSGTNSTDRRIAAEMVVRELVGAGAVGAVSTHDLTLTQIAADGENVHMAGQDGDPLAFDYLVRPGICTQSNALAILKMAGVGLKPSAA